MKLPLPRTTVGRLALTIPFLVAVVVLLWWQGPNWSLVGDAFRLVHWRWIAAAVALNIASAVVRSLSWRTVIHQGLPEPHPRYRYVFSAFSIGLLANAVLPGRIGELARVAVLTRRFRRRGDAWAALTGTVFAHRVLEFFPALALVVYVLLTARIPHWAISGLAIALALGAGLLGFGVVSARRHHVSPVEEGLTAMRRLVTMARRGLGVLRSPVAAVAAICFQSIGWFLQLLAVYVAMRGFNIEAPLAAAALVLLLMNVAMIFPLWPGNIGLLQAAIALPLTTYGIAYHHGFAFGIGVQAIEASVGVGVGLAFLAREGLSFAMLKRMPDAAQAELPVRAREHVEPERAPEGARVPG
jgi:uncharacterized membrane protein YbhN (UPF0104 family)